ncbi:hypothetical protein HDU78_007049 [Chytriomyces hyalinus]|nr:hypothetical protein HDU78_007049 [Chytriomyces hyalinus]
MSIVHVVTHPLKGRCVIASRDVSAGEVVHVARSYGAVPDSERYPYVCAQCLSPTVTPAKRESASSDASFEAIKTKLASRASSASKSSNHHVKRSMAPTEPKRLEISCKGNCQRSFYCTLECRDSHWEHGGHALACPAMHDFLTNLGGKTMAGPVEEYARLLINVLAARAMEAMNEGSDAKPEVEMTASEQSISKVLDGTPIPIISPKPNFKDMWKLVSNADSYSHARVQEEFLPIAWALARSVICFFHPKVPQSQFPSADAFLPFSEDVRFQSLAKEVVFNSSPTTNPLHDNQHITSLFEPALPSHQPNQSSSTDKQKDSTSLQFPPPTVSRTTAANLLASCLSLISKEECNSFGHYAFSYTGHTCPRQGYAIAVHPSAVFFNHACAPNVGHVPRGSAIVSKARICEPGMMVFYAIGDIKKGEEMCLSYVGVDGWHNYKFASDLDSVGNAGVMTGEKPESRSMEMKAPLKKEDSDSSIMVDTLTRSIRQERALKRRRQLKQVFQFDCDCARCAVETAEQMHSEEEMSKLESLVEGRLSKITCCSEDCMAYVVPVELVVDGRDIDGDVTGWGQCVGCFRVVRTFGSRDI